MPPKFSYKNDSDEDKRVSPAAETARKLQEQEQQTGFNRDFADMTSPENFSKDGKEGDLGDGVRDAEEQGGWKNKVSSSYGGNPSAKGRRLTVANFKAVVKKRGALVAVLALLGIGGGIGIGVAGPFSMLVGVMQNMSITNDSSSTSLERRFMKTFKFQTSGDICTNSSIKCKEGRISNKALSQLEAKGITPIPATDTSIKTGYPTKNPTSYSIETDAGTKTVAAKDLPGFLTDNPKIAAKVLGQGGAFNLRLKAWTGKYITKKFLDPFHLKKDGGIADGKNDGISSKNRLAAALEKIRAKIPGFDSLNKNINIGKDIEKKVGTQLEKSKKGGLGYTLAVTSCVGVKAPGYIAAGIAAIQLAQLLPIVNEVILSPASKLKASGVDPSVKFTSGDMSAIGALLTDKSPRSSDGKMSSALDSPILLSALGINKGKPPVSAAYTPGYAALTSQIVVGSIAATVATKAACNAILSPAAMDSAMAVDAAVTVASSTTVIGGIVKVVGSIAATQLAIEATKGFVGAIAGKVITQIAQNDAIPKAKGQDLGDVLGISGLAFFSSGGMARNLPALKESQMSGYVALQQQNQAFQRKMDVASLSPFDTSSRYTFLGSIVYNLGVASLSTGAYDGGIFSRLLGYLKTPFVSLTTNAGAANFTPESCGYAADFGLDTTDPANTPAINAAGMPCTGITADQANMSTDEAITLVENEGWLDETKPIPAGATIDDLVSSGYIIAGTPLSDFISSCGNASSGDYLYNSAGCTVTTTTKDPTSADAKLTSTTCAGSTCDSTGFGTGAQLKDPRSLEAISVFLLDYQAIQMTNGEDDITSTSNSIPTTTAGASIDQAHIYDDSTGIACAAGTTDVGVEQGYVSGREVNIRLCSIPNTIDYGYDTKGKGPIRVNSRVSGAVLAMINAFIASPANRFGATLHVSDSFRSMPGQTAAFAQYGSPRAAPAGYSNHQMGLAIDFQLGSNTGATRPGDPAYDWLVANAKSYGYAKISNEAWHWQPLGALGSR